MTRKNGSILVKNHQISPPDFLSASLAGLLENQKYRAITNSKQLSTLFSSLTQLNSMTRTAFSWGMITNPTLEPEPHLPSEANISLTACIASLSLVSGNLLRPILPMMRTICTILPWKRISKETISFGNDSLTPSDGSEPDLWCAFLDCSVMNIVPSTVFYHVLFFLRAGLKTEPLRPRSRALEWKRRQSIFARFCLSMRFWMRSPLRLPLVVVCKPWSRTVGFS